MAAKYLDLMFTDAVRRAQKQYYGIEGKITGAPERDPLGQAETEFIAARDSIDLGSISETGWPYLQHRGRPPGFLRVTNETTLVFPDYKGNRQLLSTGNVSVNDRVALFLMDYRNRERLKILGHTRVEDARAHPQLVTELLIRRCGRASNGWSSSTSPRSTGTVPSTSCHGIRQERSKKWLVRWRHALPSSKPHCVLRKRDRPCRSVTAFSLSQSIWR